MKEKYESEIEFTNDEVTMHKNKFNKLRDEYASKEEETIVLQAVVKTKEVQLAEMQKVSSINYTRIKKLAILIQSLLVIHIHISIPHFTDK